MWIQLHIYRTTRYKHNCNNVVQQRPASEVLCRRGPLRQPEARPGASPQTVSIHSLPTGRLQKGVLRKQREVLRAASTALCPGALPTADVWFVVDVWFVGFFFGQPNTPTSLGYSVVVFGQQAQYDKETYTHCTCTNRGIYRDENSQHTCPAQILPATDVGTLDLATIETGIWQRTLETRETLASILFWTSHTRQLHVANFSTSWS